MSEVRDEHEGPTTARLAMLGLGALGVVYGDIGTSPLYAIRACFAGDRGLPLTDSNIIGILSVVIWGLVIVVGVKYLSVILRADNRGEGGILALAALCLGTRIPKSTKLTGLLVVGMAGAAFLFGDGIITPAISVLSAIEGVEVAAPSLAPTVVPASCVILFVLFVIQSRGTGSVGRMFGPLMLVWFFVIGALGVSGVLRAPRVLAAFSPLLAVRLFQANGLLGFTILGAVFLVVTGAEALYADLGHFGKRPIRGAWVSLVMPALILNYLGQGGALLADKSAIGNPFFFLAPGWAVYPMVLLSAMATVVASQAVISGVFSLMHQAIHLGLFPRTEIRHFSAVQRGQVYLPFINWTLCVATIIVVVGFGSSDALSAAYGVAVSATMLLTTFLAYRCSVDCWRWSPPGALVLFGAFLAVDTAFFASNVEKLATGGWLPVGVAGIFAVIMWTWHQGMGRILQRAQTTTLTVGEFIQSIQANPPQRVPGVAVYIGRLPGRVPHSLLHNLKHNRVLHEQVFMLTVQTADVPRVPRSDRLHLERLGNGLMSLEAHYGFMERPDIPRLLRTAELPGPGVEAANTSYFIGRETVVVTRKKGMMRWRKLLFAFLHKALHQSSPYYTLPPGRVVELGAQIEL